MVPLLNAIPRYMMTVRKWNTYYKAVPQVAVSGEWCRVTDVAEILQTIQAHVAFAQSQLRSTKE